MQWEDFAPGAGRRILKRHRGRICRLNEDMQGTGAIAPAASISAVRVCGTPLHNHRVVIFRAGTTGVGVADPLRDAMVREGLSKEDAVKRFWCVDRQGLLTTDIGDRRPAILVGASASGGSFTGTMIREMAAHTERPISFVLSGPRARAEANPADLISWTDGRRALIATGSPFGPVTHKGVTYVVGQLNNAMLSLGLCLGAIVSRAAAVAEGLARVKFNDIVQQVQDAIWQPESRRIQAS
ncbi:MAG: malic enzyme-like NAD(P)-binding protein [Candidatus Sulfopaludibacter sp.]|nr:malic enzyme-like NAD(P)-binding protein [Candidatus Sulfopaludibacter sp.]